jgi:hypothetical protein
MVDTIAFSSSAKIILFLNAKKRSFPIEKFKNYCLLKPKKIYWNFLWA